MRVSALLLLPLALLAACADNPPLPPVASVDLDRFMGRWYVIAAIPSFPEREAYNAVETYSRMADGRIHTDFRFRKGSFEAEEKALEAKGTVVPGSNNAVWGEQFIWPIQAEYIIADLDPQYSHVIVARRKRDYVWIMARTPEIPAALYERLKARVAALGYDATKLRMVPQRWPPIRKNG